MTHAEALQALPDLTLGEAAARWGVSSHTTIKKRAQALGVELRRESSTRTVWPAEAVALGDRLADHLRQPGATLATFPEALPPVSAPGADSEGVSQTAPMAPGDGARRPRALPPVSALTAGTDGMGQALALAQLAAALAPPAPADPLAVARGLAEAAALGAWLSTAELAQLLGMAPGTVRSWSTGHRPRPGFEVQRRKDGAAVWWRITAATVGTDC